MVTLIIVSVSILYLNPVNSLTGGQFTIKVGQQRCTADVINDFIVSLLSFEPGCLHDLFRHVSSLSTKGDQRWEKCVK